MCDGLFESLVHVGVFGEVVQANKVEICCAIAIGKRLSIAKVVFNCTLLYFETTNREKDYQAYQKDSHRLKIKGLKIKSTWFFCKLKIQKSNLLKAWNQNTNRYMIIDNLLILKWFFILWNLFMLESSISISCEKKDNKDKQDNWLNVSALISIVYNKSCFGD